MRDGVDGTEAKAVIDKERKEGTRLEDDSKEAKICCIKSLLKSRNAKKSCKIVKEKRLKKYVM